MFKRVLYNWSPPLVYFGIIFLLSSFPLHAPPGSDKFWHVLEYSLLGFFIARAVLLTFSLPRWGAGLFAIFLGGFLGVLDEFHQYFVPARTASGFDALADLAGAALGTLLFIFFGVLLFKNAKLYPRTGDKCC